MTGPSVVQPFVATNRADAMSRLDILTSGIDHSSTGVYLATSNAGAVAAAAFWAEALSSGVAFASPQGFPETLPSEPATTIARLLGMRGPNHTLCGECGASQGALETLNRDLADETIRYGLLIRWDDRCGGRIALAALLSAHRLIFPSDADAAADCIITLAHRHAETPTFERMIDA